MLTIMVTTIRPDLHKVAFTADSGINGFISQRRELQNILLIRTMFRPYGNR